jgi:predicted transcriptional regulator
MATKKARETQANLERALDFVQKAIQTPDKYPDDLLVVPLSANVMSLFTPERVRLLQFLRERGPVASVTELAAKLHRDIAQVSRDLTRLKDVGLVRLEAVGKAKRIVGTERSILVA